MVALRWEIRGGSNARRPGGQKPRDVSRHPCILRLEGGTGSVSCRQTSVPPPERGMPMKHVAGFTFVAALAIAAGLAAEAAAPATPPAAGSVPQPLEVPL